MNTRRFLFLGGLTGGWLFVLSLFIGSIFFTEAASLTNIAGSDTLSASRSVINNNFSAVNQQLTYNAEAVIISVSSANAFRIYNPVGSTTVLTVDTTRGSTTFAGMVLASQFFGTSTASSTFGGLIVGNGMRLSATGFQSCNLDTDSNGYLQCGSDATGAGDVTVNTGTLNRFAVYGGDAAIYSGNPFQMSTSTGSTTWPIINVGTLTATSGTSWINALTLGSALPIASGGTNGTSFLNNTLLWFNGTSIVSTSSRLTVGSLVASTTATSTFAGPIQLNSGVFKDGILTSSITFSTSTLAYASGSTTFTKILSYPISIQRFYCLATNGGTFNAVIGDGAASSSMISVSGTRGDTTSSIAVTEAETIYLVVGTTATSPTGTCSFDYYRTN